MDQKKPAPQAPAQPSTPPPQAAPAPAPVKPPPDYSELLKQALDALKQVGNELAAGLNQVNKTLETLKLQQQGTISHAIARPPRIDDAPDSPKF